MFAFPGPDRPDAAGEREDHANAKALAEGLTAVDGLTVTPPQSNMVFVKLAPELATRLSEALRERGVAASSWPGGRMRWVTHLDVDRTAVDEVIAAVREITESPRSKTPERVE
jgi:threonine aldolase